MLAPALAWPERMLGPRPEEQRIVDRIGEVTHAYRGEHPLRYHVLVPLHVLRTLIAHSNLNLYLFQHTLRGHWWMELLRWCSALAHITLLLGVFLAPWWRMDATVRGAAFGAALYVIYLAYVQRGVEERYTLPVLHLAVLCMAFMSDAVWRTWSTWRRSETATNS